MFRYNYNPFHIDIQNLRGEHLKVLKDVTEGWYVDYKQEMIEIKKISKQLSSFSNQYGGWVFFGIQESEKRTAGKFVGVPRNKVEPHLLRIREASTAHVNPNVYYEDKVIYGPVEEIGLEDNKAIIVLYIPEGANPPYIASSGKIYRRLVDQSDPVAETDRNVLDILWEKGNRRRQKTKDFLNFRSSWGEPTIPVIYVHILSNPCFNKRFSRIDYDSFREVFLRLRSEEIFMPMDSIHSVSGGLMAKQTTNNDPLGIVPSIRWWHAGNALITIPLNLLDGNTPNKANHDYVHLNDFLSELQKQGLANASVCDFNYFLSVLLSLYAQLTNIYRQTNNRERLHASFSLENAQKMIPFIDDSEYLERVKNLGASLIEDRFVRFPRNWDDEDLLILKQEKRNKVGWTHSLLEITPLFARLFRDTGILDQVESLDKIKKLFTGLLNPKRFKKS